MKEFCFLRVVAIILTFCFVASCSNYIKNENGSEKLVKIDAEPIGCQYLYKLESEVSVYEVDDAERYLQNKIIDQVRGGNSYWITSSRTRPNGWVVFGPERVFILTANVYDCPNPFKIETKKSVIGKSTIQQDGWEMYEY